MSRGAMLLRRMDMQTPGKLQRSEFSKRRMVRWQGNKLTIEPPTPTAVPISAWSLHVIPRIVVPTVST